MLCDHLEEWDREGGCEGDARGKRYGDICICIAGSLCYQAETNTPLQNNYTPIKMLEKIILLMLIELSIIQNLIRTLKL